MSNNTVIYTVEKGVAEIRFNRPHRLNAVVTEFYVDLLSALDEAESDGEVRVIVLTGEGRAFCVGADLKEHGSGKRTDMEKVIYLNLANRVCQRIYEHPKVIIAAVNGFALGAGCEMAVSADFILMKENAQIGTPEVSIGTHVGGALTELLPRLIGLSKAREMIFMGERIDGRKAYEIGLATRFFSQEEYEEGVRVFAERIASKAPVSMSFAKQHLNDMKRDYNSRLISEATAIRTCMLTEDWQEGVDAFAEKRNPVFTGR